ncbi:MAG: Isochorismatase family protein [Planctomycetes bacterium ADurb.Bin126]|nr:MAG: Isochorismatase family protein [Planctomycetes bacterium ADurb.Bin126]HOD83171.1 protein-signal peptide and transmembrane prediction [Phycisphaerae bacterium]HQL74070.1 protein-signal peptide and transmembrane prediction [Phycisphaerae bacterium]
MSARSLVLVLSAGWLAAGLVLSQDAPPQAPAGELSLTLRSRKAAPTAPAGAKPAVSETPVRWAAKETAAIICDMWDKHWCAGATARVAEMAPRMNELVGELRRHGVLIIHCPSGTLGFYKDHPGRKLAQATPKAAAKIPLQGWMRLDPKREGPLPIDDSDGGCDCQPRCKGGSPWRRQIATIQIADGDAITDSAEAYYLMRQRGIRHVLVMGVHTNMCVLGRPFGIRQLVTQGLEVALVRDMTDTMYNSRMPPRVSHFRGTDLVIEHIERYWCPSVTSDQVLGGAPFRFKDDERK